MFAAEHRGRYPGERSVALLAPLLIVACSGALSSHGRSTSNVPAIVTEAIEADAAAESLPLLALMLGPGEIWAVDPEDGREVWRRPIRAFAEPAVHGRTAVIPILGQQLLAIDAYDGTSKWQVPLPGQALTGVSLDSSGVVVTALSERPRHRSVAVGLSLLDGQRHWQKPSRELLGGPASLSGYTFIPVADTVSIVQTRSGRAVGRMKAFGSGPLERVEHRGNTLLATSPRGFVDLYGGGGQLYPISRADVEPFEGLAGFAQWIGNSDGIEFRLLAGLHPGAPRDAIFMARRVLIAVRLDGHGRPAGVRWIHFQAEQAEFVALECTEGAIIVAREDGALLRFDPASGRRAAGIIAVGPIDGAVFVGGRRSEGLPRSSTRLHHRVLTRVLLLLDDPDPRLVPAQALLLEVLWRHPHPQIRALVADRASGDAGVLQAKAQALVQSPAWGHGTLASTGALVERFEYPGIAQRPEFIALTKNVVEAGGPAAARRMVEFLGDPGTPPQALEAIMLAVRRLDDASAVPAVSAFVRRYHADPEIASESMALYVGLEYLLSQASEPLPPRRPESARDAALDVLREILAAEFTDPRVRAFLRKRMK